MKKAKRISIILIACLLVAAMLTACNLPGNLDFKDYDEFKEKTKNYSMTIKSEGETIRLKVCEDGYLYENDTAIFFYNAAEKKGYTIDKTDNTGSMHTYDSGEEFYNLDTSLVGMLYAFQIFSLFMKKQGTEKIAGRNCTVYGYDSNGSSAKFWLDDEFGMCLKSESTSDGKTETLEVTEFTLGGVTLGNMINLSAYTIDEGDPQTGKTVSSIAVNANTVPVNKTPSNLVLGDIKITVSYSDGSSEQISLTESMLSENDLDKLESAGTYTITVNYSGKTATFNITLVAVAKTVSSIEVKSSTIPVGKTPAQFNLGDVKLTVTYSDSTTNEIPLAESMLSQTDLNKLETAGEHSITVSYSGKSATFTVTLASPSASKAHTILNSFWDFYYNLILRSDPTEFGFISQMEMNFVLAAPGTYDQKIIDYFDESISDRAGADAWSAPILLLDAVAVYDSYAKGIFDTTEVNIEGGGTKTPSCEDTEDGFIVKYANTKGLYKYWFESEVKYDAATDSLSAEIYCGVNENKELKYIIEYNKSSNGYYACLIHFPDELVDGNPQSYTTLKLYFKQTAGKISINRWTNAVPAASDLVFEKTDSATYADSGDVVLATDGTTVTCPIDNLESGFYSEYLNMIAAFEDNFKAIYDEDAETEEYYAYEYKAGDLRGKFEYDFYAGSNSVEYIIKHYDNKLYLYLDEEESLTVTLSGDTYLITYSNDYEEVVMTVKYTAGSFYIEKEVVGDYEYSIRFQWVKIGDEHFIEYERCDGSYENTRYAFSETDNTMKCTYLYELEESLELDIYGATDLTISDFAEMPNGSEIPFYEYFSYEDEVLEYYYQWGFDD